MANTKPGVAAQPQSSLAQGPKGPNALKKNVSVKEDPKPNMNGR